MDTNATYCQNNPQPSVEIHSAQDGLSEMSHPELTLMQEITLQQMAESDPATRLLLGRVWYRLEQERRRRRDAVTFLEQMYFSS